MTEATTEPETPCQRLSGALARMRGICAVLTDLAEGGDEDAHGGALLYLVNRFEEDCEVAQSAYDEMFDHRRATQ